MGQFLWRASVIVHRYLGVVLGLPMMMWFCSGIVMMYVGYPQLSDKDRLRTLSPIPWDRCCNLAALPLEDDDLLRAVRLEGIAGTPVMVMRLAGGPERVASLGPDNHLGEIDGRRARLVALDAASRIAGHAAPLVAADTVERDQWTVAEDYDSDRPMFHFTFGDPERTQIYVSHATGEVVLWTTRTQRFWNWLGAIPHWLYPTVLRSHPYLWTQVIVWAAVLGTFLTAFGLVLGMAQFGRGQGGRISPYRGWFYWHHVVGLVFGIFTLAFVASGLVSMNPWGFLEASGGGQDILRLVGEPLPWGAVGDSFAALKRNPPTNAVRIRTAPLAGKLYWLSYGSNGSVERFDAAGLTMPATAADLRAAATRLAGERGIVSQGMIAAEDAYYFSHHDDIVLPAYRVVLNDAGHTRYYLDPASGLPLKRADGDGQSYRWLFAALHRWDFLAVLRARPVWDIVMLTLLLGGLAGTGAGVYLAIRRVVHDLTAAGKQ